MSRFNKGMDLISTHGQLSCHWLVDVNALNAMKLVWLHLGMYTSIITASTAHIRTDLWGKKLSNFVSLWILMSFSWIWIKKEKVKIRQLVLMSKLVSNQKSNLLY